MSERQPIDVGKQSRVLDRFRNALTRRLGLGRKATECRAENEIVISTQLQKSNFDCGQTVLDMLGYKGHEMYPNNAVTSDKLRSLPGAKEVTLPVGQEEELDYNYPKVWIILGKDKVAGAQHWIIRHRNRIYCPTIGKMDVREYKKRYVAFVLQEFEIPVIGQQTPEEYYRQHGIKQPKGVKKRIRRETAETVESEPKKRGGEYGSWEWAEHLAEVTDIHDPNWWYNCAGARGHREEHGIKDEKR